VPSSLPSLPDGLGMTAPPLHGYRGEMRPSRMTRPRGVTIAISRESGARGSTVARKLAELLGWQVYDQEMLSYLLQDTTGREQLLADLPAGARGWANENLERLQRERKLNADAETTEMVRLILTLAARGEVIIVGRGAGHLLPAETTLHARVIAPFEDRVSYFTQWLRMTRAEAASEVRACDERRSRFLNRTLNREPNDLYAYDLVVNPSRLGIEGAAQLISWALKAKHLLGVPEEMVEDDAGELIA